jgi:transcriptional regulator with XRE-family HTH domain
MSAKRLGMLIKQLRERNELTQTELAKRAGVSQGYIAKLEPSNRPKQRKTARQSNPSITVLQRLAKALKVKVTELLE